MYTLQRGNVVKLTDSTVKRDKYIADGFELVEEPAENPAENPDKLPEENPDKLPEEGAPAEPVPADGKPKKKGKSDD